MYFSTIREVGTAQVLLSKPSQVRPIKIQPQQPGNGVQSQQQPQQQKTVQQTPPQQQIRQQPVGTKLNAVTMNKRQIPNGSTNTVNSLKQAQKPIQINKPKPINASTDIVGDESLNEGDRARLVLPTSLIKRFKPMQQLQQAQEIHKKMSAAAMNKRQIPNGAKNTVNALKQAQKPLGKRK